MYSAANDVNAPDCSSTARNRVSNGGQRLDIRHDAAAAGNGPAAVRLEIGALVRMRRRRSQLEIVRTESPLRTERLLDGPAAGNVIERGGQREARLFATADKRSAPGPCRSSARRRWWRGRDPAALPKRSPRRWPSCRSRSPPPGKCKACCLPGPFRSSPATLRPFADRITWPGLRKNEAVCSAAVISPPGIIAQIEHQALQIAPAQLLDAVVNLPRRPLFEGGDADVSDAGLQFENALHAGRFHVLGSQLQLDAVSRYRDGGPPAAPVSVSIAFSSSTI